MSKDEQAGIVRGVPDDEVTIEFGSCRADITTGNVRPAAPQGSGGQTVQNSSTVKKDS